MKFFLLWLISFSALASSLSLDVGQTSTVFNRISIPKSQSDQLTLPTEDTITSYRITGFYDLENKNQIYFLYAPLEVEYSFTSNKNFTFHETNFYTGQNTTLRYKFNSYRLGYLWTWIEGSLKYWAGFVGKIRDADTEVTQGSTSDSFDNIGFVPLASFGFDWILGAGWSIYSHTDALGASQGSAYDSQIEIKYDLDSLSVSLGKRILGGGADNDTVYNFAQFDTFYTKLAYQF